MILMISDIYLISEVVITLVSLSGKLGTYASTDWSITIVRHCSHFNSNFSGYTILHLFIIYSYFQTHPDKVIETRGVS